MKVEYYKEYSPCLERDMEYKVYGHAGTPILVFPSQNGRFFDFENNGMVATVEDLIDNGNIQLFCCDICTKILCRNFRKFSFTSQFINSFIDCFTKRIIVAALL